MCVSLLGSQDRVWRSVCARVHVCGVNSREERIQRARGEFPRGARLGQGKMSGALEVRMDEEKDGGEEGAHEKVSKTELNVLKKKKERGGLWEFTVKGA